MAAGKGEAYLGVESAFAVLAYVLFFLMMGKAVDVGVSNKALRLLCCIVTSLASSQIRKMI